MGFYLKRKLFCCHIQCISPNRSHGSTSWHSMGILPVGIGIHAKSRIPNIEVRIQQWRLDISSNMEMLAEQHRISCLIIQPGEVDKSNQTKTVRIRLHSLIISCSDVSEYKNGTCIGYGHPNINRDSLWLVYQAPYNNNLWEKNLSSVQNPDVGGSTWA